MRGGPNPEMSVLTKRGHLDSVADMQRKREWRNREKTVISKPRDAEGDTRKAQPCQHHGLGLLASRLGDNISVV